MANLLGGALGTGMLSAGLSKLLGPAAGQLAGSGLSGVINTLGAAAKPVGGSTTSGASNPLGSQVQTTQPTQTTQSPEKPELITHVSDVQYPTYQDALARAKSRFEPQLDSALLSDSELARDQNRRLVQALAAGGKGSARGGHRMTGEYNLTQDQNARRDKLKNDYASLISGYADQLFTGETNAATQRLNTSLANRDATNAALLQQYGIDTNAYLQKSQQEISRADSFNSQVLRWLGILMPDYLEGVG